MTERKYTKEEYEEVMRLHSLGYGSKKIAKIINFPLGTINRWLYTDMKPRIVWSEKEKKRESVNKRNARLGKRHTEESNLKNSLAHLGSKSSRWKGDNAKETTKRRRGYYMARKLYPAPKGYHRHHIDGNPLNNNPENILIIKPRTHMIIDGRLDKMKKGYYVREYKHTPEQIERFREQSYNRKRNEKGQFMS